MNTFWIILVASVAITLIFINGLRSMRDRRGE
jgi:hypothetical protein